MASLIKIPKSGAYRITITDGEKQRYIHIGKVNKKTAELCLSNIEQILSYNAAGQALPVEVATWTANIGDELHAKLVKAGLLQERQRRTLGEFITQYTDGQKWKPNTVNGFRTAMTKLLAYFGDKTPLTQITAEQAHSFRSDLVQKAMYSEAHISKIIQRSKQIFNAARKQKLISESPFEDVRRGSMVNKARQYFVTIEEATALIDACNNPLQRLIIALSRWGGLRVPSELVGLKWSEINWDKTRFLVHSPKTEHHAGGDKRIVPIFPELYPFFREAFEAAPEGIDAIFPELAAKTKPKSLSSFIQKRATKAAIKLWAKPFQNMRSSRATELLETFPNHVVNEWLGHTEAVAELHYRQVTEEHYERAAKCAQEKTDAFHAAAGIAGFGDAGRVQECAQEHAGNGLNCLEAAKGTKPQVPVIQGLSNRRKSLSDKEKPAGGIEPSTSALRMLRSAS
ncbi:hypothetical protein FACS189454_08440 [Planctomycetales bacterium]|nr:hypothetical protein FACS189454_08440 [Planctomycetales bacterium]